MKIATRTRSRIEWPTTISRSSPLE
jgi:hypothetical protein